MIVFFSGGSGLRLAARELARRGIRSGHVITTFDSGGSSRQLRLAFGMPAVGDLRNRLIALSHPSRSAEAALLNFRLPATFAKAEMALEKLNESTLPARHAAEIFRDLTCFLDNAPTAFDARNASIGNLALAGAYLRHARALVPAVRRYARILGVNGQVLPIANEPRHLAAILVNGQAVAGQHKFKCLPAAVRAIVLAHEDGSPAQADLEPAARSVISGASLLCFAMGSFYSSLLSTLLPKGVGRAIAQSKAKKIFIPNTGHDPELFDLDLPGQAAAIMACLRQDAPELRQPIDAMLIDPVNGIYPGGCGQAVRARLARLGIEMLEAPVVQEANLHNPAALLDALLELGQYD